MILLSFLFSALFGFVAYIWAKQEGRNPWIWFLVGFALGIFGLFILWYIPKFLTKVRSKKEKPIEQNLAPPEEMFFSDKRNFEQMWHHLDEKNEISTAISFQKLQSLWKEKKIVHINLKRSFQFREQFERVL